MENDGENGRGRLLYRIAPGLEALLNYRFSSDFRHDLLAGLSVAAVALPVAVAYAELAGFQPVVGLYSCILPLVAYAIFGTSKQLMVNPDAATCAMVAAAVAPLAAGNADLYWSLSVTLAFFCGLFCILASVLRLGALADFLSKPILVGFLNGIAISILLGQIGKIFGFPIQAGGIVPRLIEFLSKLPQTHLATLAVGVGAFGVLLAVKRLLPRLPSSLVAMILAAIAVALLHLDHAGVAVLGKLPQGLPPVRWPVFPADELPQLIGAAAGLALVLFSSGMLTARSFAERHRQTIDVDREFAAFGAANIASAISQGFAVTGADSRTAMAYSAGGRTQMTGIVAAGSIALVLLFFTQPLQYVPVAALGAVLIFASFNLFDVSTLRQIWSVDKRAVGLSVLTTLGVVAFGAIQAILVAVILSLLQFVKVVARPKDEVLGRVPGMAGWHGIGRHSKAETIPGVVIYRFSSAITFFNSNYFKQRALLAVKSAGPGVRFFVLDAIPIATIDVTGLYALGDLNAELERQGITMLLAGRRTELLMRFRETKLYRPEYERLLFPTMKQAIGSCRTEFPAPAPAS
ncbi:MAG TPA: SulP family inorganic anion transporter [Tepidisphaeraceae bacterium]